MTEAQERAGQMVCARSVNSMDCSPPGPSVRGIVQARILEWVAIFSSESSSWPMDWTWVSCIGRWILYHWATCVLLEVWQMNEPRMRCMFSLSCDDPVHAILYTDLCMFFMPVGVAWGRQWCGSGPKPLPREDGERHRESGLGMVMSESYICPVWGLHLVTLWGCLYKNLST